MEYHVERHRHVRILSTIPDMFLLIIFLQEFLVTHVFRSDKAVERENIQQRQLPVRRKTCIQVFENQFNFTGI